MFGKPVKAEKANNFEEKMYKALYETVQNALESILNYEYKKKVENGKEIIDYELTARMMKAQARISLDLIENIVKEKSN
ncbi:hypothetical protein [Pumilibacter muris]|uniref:hypothetical protein n=1 Tax=Pumilibacter muris TaxID=2941510 RepID=UPI002040FD84|nr:hypothetical protein [Pumilibacter muris]